MGRRIDQEARRDVQIAVVFHHARVEHLGLFAAGEFRELVFAEGAADLDGAVAAEVHEDHAVAGDDRAYGALAVVHDDEGRQVLVDDAGLLGA